MKPGQYVPAGRILVVRDDSTVFGFGREPAFFCQSHVLEYQLFRARGRRYKRNDWRKPHESIKKKEADITDWKRNRELPVGKLSVVKYDWRVVNPPLLVRAMVGARDTLFIAGPPDVIDETKLHGRFGEPGVVAGLARISHQRSGQPFATFGYDRRCITCHGAQSVARCVGTAAKPEPQLVAAQVDSSPRLCRGEKSRLARQQSALGGEMGGLLRAVSAEDGTTLAEYRLASPPVFDGIAAAHGRLFLSAIDGASRATPAGCPEGFRQDSSGWSW